MQCVKVKSRSTRVIKIKSLMKNVQIVNSKIETAFSRKQIFHYNCFGRRQINE